MRAYYIIPLAILLIISPVYTALAQDNTPEDTSMYADAYFVLNSVTITPNTIYEVDIEAARERSRWRYRTLKVYPYAIRALELMKELDEVTADMDRRKDRRKYKKQLEDELKASFKEDMKGLTKTQGKLLIDILERQTERTFYDILKDLKSGTTAFFWQGLGKTYGYDLKEGYDATGKSHSGRSA